CPARPRTEKQRLQRRRAWRSVRSTSMSRPATPVAAAARQAVLDRIRGRDLLTGEYSLILSADAVTAVQDARAVFLAAEEEGDEQRLIEARSALEVAHEQLTAETVVLRFTGLPSAAYRALMDAHEPTEAQREEAAKHGVLRRWNPDTFPDALIAATCTDPGFDSVEQVAALLSSTTGVLSEAEHEQVFNVARLT